MPWIQRGWWDVSAGFNPVSISGLKLWLKADSLALNDSDPVSTWTDQSGNANDVSNTLTARPTYKTNILNTSMPVVRFDGTNDVLETAATIATNLRPNTCFIVVNLPDASRRGAALNLGKTSGGFGYGVGANNLDTNGNEQLLIFNGIRFIDINYTIGTGGHVLAFTLETSGASTLSTFYADSTTARGTNTGPNANTISGVTQVGGCQGVANRFCNYDIGEILYYDALLNAAQLGQVLAYLGARWGVTIS